MSFFALVARDVRLAFGDGTGVGTALGFYLVVVAILPIGLGPDLNLLSRIAPGVLWIALLLSALLATDRIFLDDLRDGTLDLLVLGPMPLEGVAAAKILAHWLTTALPLVLVTPLLGLMLNLEIAAYGPILLAMLVGTPAVSAIGALGAALTVGARRGGLLLSLIVLPLYVPTLIFGVSVVDAAIATPGSPVAPLAILGAISLATVVLAPLGAAAALRYQMG